MAENYSSMWTALRGYAFSQGWVDAAGVKTRFLHCGANGSPALIMLHGIVGHAEAFIKNLGPHGQHFNCYAIDQLGNGYTDKPPIDCHIPLVADHVRDFMDAVGLKTASVMGTSFGSRVAARFAVNHAHRVAKLILISPGGFRYHPALSERIYRASLKTIEDTSWQSIRSRLEGYMVDPSVVTDDYVACRQAICQQPGYQEAMRRSLVSHSPEWGEYNLVREDEYRSIQAPTLVVLGGREDERAVEAGEIADIVPNGRLYIMKNVGHWPYFERPEEFNRISLEFLRS
jgi:2-hydroxy-6-oxonona-2,4-dienedioate hydrolase